MRNISFYYTLDVAYKLGIDYRLVTREREAGKNVDAYYSDKETSIYLSWSLEGKYYKELVGARRIKPCDWDFKAKLPNRKRHYELHVFLQSLKSRIDKEFLRLWGEMPPTPASIREMVHGIINGPFESAGEKTGLFWRKFDEFHEEKRQLTKPSTVAKYNTVRKTLQKFEKAYYPITFEVMTSKWYRDFLIYSIGLGRLTNTISKDISQLKAYMNWAYEMKYHRFLEFKKFKAESETSEPIFLTIEELGLIEKYVCKSTSLSIAKDVLLIGSYTGQRISDILGFRKKHLKEFADGSVEWELYQQKGRKSRAIHIFLIDKARKIIDKYLEDKGDNDFIFPRISPIVINRKLKKLGELAGVNAPTTKVSYSGKNRNEVTLPKYAWLTTHTGRRTFITALCTNSMPIHEIRSMSGHASNKEISPYQGVLKDSVRKGLMRAFEPELEVQNNFFG